MDGFRKYKDLFFALRESKKDMGDFLFLLEKILEKFNLSDESTKELKKKLNDFTNTLKKKWTIARYTDPRFLKQNQAWLEIDFEYPTAVLADIRGSSSANITSQRSSGKQFNDLSVSSKKRRIEPLLHNFSTEELTYAACSSLYTSGKRNIAKIIKKADEYVNASGKHIAEPIKSTLKDALALFVDGDYTKESYQSLRMFAKTRNADIFPAYNFIHEAKEQCYPTSIRITDISAEVDIQDLADHTTKRLFRYLENNVEFENIPETVKFLFKWGCDGSSGHSRYNQEFSDSNNTDEYLFAICMVPLILRSDGTVLWINPSPSSTRFCRPIKIMLKHKSSDLIKMETEKIEGQIQNLMPLTVTINNRNIIVEYQFKLTMIDGKAFSAITESSNQSCAICKATPRMMNNLNLIKTLPTIIDFYQYGISNLHAWIKSMECILHISYRIEIKKWQMRSSEEKSQYEKRKTNIQKNLKERLNILVDIPKQGFGTTNTGNIARTFFENYATAANITGVNEELIKRLGVILVSLSSSRQICPDLFQQYAMETYNLYITEYNWYYMPTSLHKIIYHGADIIKSSALPVGMFSEEALEARNKDIRNAREHHTRKSSRCNTMTDLFHSLLYTSDIYISSISAKNRRIGKKHARFDMFKEDVDKLMLPEQLEDDNDGSS